MLSIPDEYQINKKFALKTFLSNKLTPKEKKQFREVVEEVELSYQITGEGIPSLIDEEFNCQVILFFSIKITNLKKASFVGNVIQKLVKPFCVIRFYDYSNKEIYCFCYKRLNSQDRTQIVIEHMVYSSLASTQFEDKFNLLMNENVGFDKIQNKSNKLDFYLEMMIKTFIISNLQLWSGTKQILMSKVWYNRPDMIELYSQFMRIEQLKKEQKSALTVVQHSRINGELKRLYSELNRYIGRV
ncbi:DUF4391 domain-containing protein [Sporolactobacillus sp. STSJ-5]|uniref:DUF4391 domain-containing protein n=1 Tax=Sporolactobacillus sp. STSJ-5 TaxID=2965076 RepID=UPI0021030FD8|nr:DUF4391 domain-containing protein [Sporolactobacillus sp. STSJ-5]MCQ2011179.1 DUF4391 domain-containing protein [Sporolactobacillus sp. STSJ-5]